MGGTFHLLENVDYTEDRVSSSVNNYSREARCNVEISAKTNSILTLVVLAIVVLKYGVIGFV